MLDDTPVYPGAKAPDRSYDFDSNGFRLRLHTWGDSAAQPIVLSHGMYDHARGFDQLAPLLAAERLFVVAIDARGHGDSDWADYYGWVSGLQDIVRVMRSLGRRVHLLGHSKGGSQATEAAVTAPACVDKLINIEGFGPPKEGFLFPGQAPGASGAPAQLAAFLDGSRRNAEHARWRAYDNLERLVQRRQAMNPRLSRPWLEYFVWHGARRDLDGYRWKVDPLAGHGAGPFNMDWIAPSWRPLEAPMLAIVGSEPDTWGPPSQALLDERLAFVRRVRRIAIPQAGHFPHMEQPAAVARAILEFLRDG